ncbi:nucleotide exchange factor GrpE [Peribacillus psychrosaccharolyticus]|uniref:Protein GrpE n=1 Tax=Peribacillus psychrosaccharolyticus TaxID=1407 RepID=A0A974NL31_PERPY|nr:nucleotide exchange factor GrpE [Peribacillus psychrosaccharolyticus]MEC2054344.1 nucleotide exchange factor GrpE [Peribacillus psychrosaccharolyticus]MED3744428.1 nucleotide exchange factor GrpE [Peribacillus psychrosaccharolyticus]QQS99900.1 nucleotide exchange factor GrpE [Peribacillus psychrosaccharolyticus]
MTETNKKDASLENENTEDKNLEETPEAEVIFAEEEIEAENVETPSEEDSKLADLEAKYNELENRYLRLQADFDNSRRRARLDAEAAQKYRAQSLASDLLTALDNFERATKVEANNEQTKSLLSGMDMVYKGLLEALKKEGITPIETVGKEFDPHLHQAVMQVEDDSFDANVVVEEFQKGYMLKDRVLRPAMVKVNG